MPDLKFKLVFLGPALSGKTSICGRFLTGSFDLPQTQTIGVDFYVTTFNISKLNIKLYIWDFGGEERFEFLYKTYLRNFNGAVIVFDLNNKRDYDKISKFINIIKKDDKPYAIIGNKLDLISDIDIIKERNEIKEYCKQEEIPYLETSAKSDINIENLFLLISKEMLTSKMISKYSNLYNREELKNISNVKIITEDDHIFISNQVERINLFIREGNFEEAIILGESAKAFSQKRNLNKWSKKVKETLKKIDFLIFQKQQEVKEEALKESDHPIKKLLKIRECEYLDFKSEMYKMNDSNQRIRLEAKKEFLKDILGLANNFRETKSPGISYLLIGVAESRGKYNGVHQNITFNDIKILKDLIRANLKPDTLTIELNVFYISGDATRIFISDEKKKMYNRNIILKIEYTPGIVYEFKRNFGNPQIGVPYYTEGTSFYRDGSYTRPMTEEIRVKIRELLILFNREKIPSELMNSLSKCYNSIEKLCNFQFKNIRYKDIIHRNAIEKILVLLDKYKKELVEHLDLYFEVKRSSKFSMDFITTYKILLNELEITIHMRVDYIADVFMHLNNQLIIDQIEIKPFLIKLKKKLNLL